MSRVAEFLRKSREFSGGKCIFYLFKASGIAAISLNTETPLDANGETYRFSHSAKDVAPSLFLIIFMVTTTCVTAYGYFAKSTQNNDSVYYTSDVVGFSSAICIVAIFGIKREQQVIIYNDLIAIRAGINEDRGDEGSNSGRDIDVVPVIFILASLLVAISDSVNDFDFAMYCLSMNICHFVVASVAMQYWIVVTIAKQLRASLNAKLSGCSMHADGFASVLQVEDKLSRFWQLHVQLDKLSRDISAFYSLSVLLTVTNALLVTTSVIYDIIAKPMVIRDDRLAISDYLRGLCFIFPYLYSVVMLTSRATAAVNESERTRDIVAGLLRKSQSRGIRDKLRQFSISLLYGVVEFTVFDFFSLNGSLVVSIVGSITAYLVIILQFQSEECTSQDES